MGRSMLRPYKVKGDSPQKSKATASEGGRYIVKTGGYGMPCPYNGEVQQQRRSATATAKCDSKAAASRRTPKWLAGGGFLFAEVGESFSLVG
jgi:hypothetical protein